MAVNPNITLSKSGMRHRRVPLSVLVAALSACVVEPEQLNSERIEAEFGSYGIEIVSFRGNVRRSSLYSRHDDGTVCRTYAIVRFESFAEAPIAEAHKRIVEGASIGATFKSHGWSVYKETRYIGRIDLGDDAHDIGARMRLDAERPLAMHVYRLFLKKGPKVIDYATIIEVHHPDYMSVDRLQRLYARGPLPRLADDDIRAFKALVTDGRAATGTFIETRYRSD